MRLQRTEVLSEIAPEDERKGTNTWTSCFLHSFNTLPVFPLGGPKGFPLLRESVRQPGVEVSLAIESGAGLVTSLRTSR